MFSVHDLLTEAFPASVDQTLTCSEIFSYKFEDGKWDSMFNLPESLKDEKLYKLQVEFTIPLKLQTVRFDCLCYFIKNF